MRSILWAAAVVWCVLAAGAAAGQESGASGDLRVFLDCNTRGCDFDFLRRQIPVVSWVRDREASDVHVLITSRTTGGGGRAFEIAFLGRGRFEGDDADLSWASPGDAVDDEIRQGLSEQIKIGLVRYVVGTPAAERLSVSFGPALSPEDPTPGAEGGSGAAAAEHDPWDFWVFRVGANFFGFGESSISDSNMFGSLSANRTTETWKIGASGNFRRNKQTYRINGDTTEYTREDWSLDGFLVRSIGSRWAVGIRASTGSSTFYNREKSWSAKPGVEYNFFPYEESSRRSLTLQYLVGPNHWDYEEETIYGEIAETRWQQSLTASLSLVQPWGRWSTSFRGQQYLHDTDLYSATISGGLNVRLFQGFSIRVSGNYSWIKDQLYLPLSDFTAEEILLRQFQQETSFRYFTSFGVEYRFGSIFNNVVNPRFGGGGGERIMMIG
jgi:hypothetical protein